MPMKRRQPAIALALAALLALPAQARPVGSAPTPPMGWNSWNAFGVNLNEERVLGSAKVLVASGLADAGYRYVAIDDGWWLKRRAADSRLQVRTGLFPSARVGGPEETSLRPFTDHIHAMGLKAGIYTDIGRNACSQAWSPDNPNLPEGSLAEREVGLHGHVAQDLALYFGAWNFDYIKVDACGLSAYGPARPAVRSGQYRALGPLIVDDSFNRTNIPAVKALYGEVRDALARLRPAGNYVLSLCAWGAANVRAWGKDYGTLSRTSNDIDPTWGRMLHNLDAVATRELYAGPGHWNDPDMLEVGNGEFDSAHLTAARSHMALWAMEAAPLIIGTDLTRASPEILAILGARGVIAIDQDRAGNQATLAYTDDERQIYTKALSRRGTKAVALFNRGDVPTDITLTAAHLKFAEGAEIALTDPWTGAELPAFTGAHLFHLAPRETVLLVASGTPELAHGWYLSELPGRINVETDAIPALEADPIIHRMADPYHASTMSTGNRPLYAGWGAPRADATPYDQTLRVAGTAYRSGLGTLAGARLRVSTNSTFTRFTGRVGIDDGTRGSHAPVRFELWGDGRRLATTGPMRFGMPAQEITARIAGVKALTLVSRQLERDAGNVVVTWAEARVE